MTTLSCTDHRAPTSGEVAPRARVDAQIPRLNVPVVDWSRIGLGMAMLFIGLVVNASPAAAGSKTYDVPGIYTYTVPATVTSLTVTAVGGNGGSGIAFPSGMMTAVPGGKGRVVTSILAVTPGEVLQINVGGAGNTGSGFGLGGGGFNGGGRAFNAGGGGGGASDVRRTPFAAADRVVVAGGGGGGASGDALGGAGGDAGSNGFNSLGSTPGNGGIAGAGGAGGTGGASPNACCSGGSDGGATNGGDGGGGNLSGAGGGGGYGGGGGGSGGVSGSGGGGGGGGGSLGTPTGFNASTSGAGSVVLTHSATTMEVIKTVSPTSDPGRFNLQINGATMLADAANGDSTGQQTVVAGTINVGETAGTGTSLSGFNSTIACDNGASGAGPGPLNVTMAAGASVICTISNTRLTGTLGVVKRLVPAGDPGRFDLLVNGGVVTANAGDGDGGSLTVNAPTATVGEAAVTPANAADYVTAIECRAGGGAGAVVASASGAGPLDVPIGGGDDIVCTFTNTRRGNSDLGLTKSASSATAPPGGTVTYRLTITNNGPDPAPNTVVTDTLPAAFTWTADDCGAGPPAGGTLTWTVGALANGASAICNVTGTLAGALGTEATNSASATSDSHDSTPPVAAATVTLTPYADLAITKTDGLTAAVPGQSVTYTIEASNAGPNAVTGATVADTLPASLTCKWTCVGAGGGTCTSGPVAGSINDSVNLPVGASATYTAICTVSRLATGTLVNTATIAVPAGVTDPNLDNNSATDTTRLGPLPVPTLSTWGFLLFGLLLTLIARRALRGPTTPLQTGPPA